jgi:dihydroorotate dehydrogenase
MTQLTTEFTTFTIERQVNHAPATYFRHHHEQPEINRHGIRH